MTTTPELPAEIDDDPYLDYSYDYADYDEDDYDDSDVPDPEPYSIDDPAYFGYSMSEY